MAFCSKCGTEVAAGAGFCPKCGEAQGGGATVVQSAQSAQSGLSENVAGFLCYLVGWITGLIFFLIDKRPFVRFHAAQLMVVFGGLHILRIVLAMLFGISLFGGGLGWTGFTFGWLLFSLIGLVALILWIVLMV